MLYRKKFLILKDREYNVVGHLKFEVAGKKLMVDIFPNFELFENGLLLYSFCSKAQGTPDFIAEMRRRRSFTIYGDDAQLERIDTFFIKNSERILYFASTQENLKIDDSVFEQTFLEDGDLEFLFSFRSDLEGIDRRLLSESRVREVVAYYGFYLYGVKRDNRNLVCFGIPAYYDQDPHPFYPYHKQSIWAKENGGTSNYGEFGYWLIGLDKLSGQFYPVYE